MPSYHDIYADDHLLQHARSKRDTAVKNAIRSFCSAIDTNLLEAIPQHLPLVLSKLIKNVQALATLLDYADELLAEPRKWPLCYPSESEWMYSIFAPYVSVLPAIAFIEAPTVVAHFHDMHEEFVRV